MMIIIVIAYSVCVRHCAKCVGTQMFLLNPMCAQHCRSLWGYSMSKAPTAMALTFCGKDSKEGILKCQMMIYKVSDKEKLRQSKRMKNGLEGDGGALSDGCNLGRPLGGGGIWVVLA